MKKLNLQNLDTESRRRLDNKFNELLAKDTNQELSARNPFFLITDSSVVNEDIKQIIDKIRLEELLLITARDEFEEASQQINLKLEEGGQNLNEQERDQLVQDVLNLRELLRKNEELFYKNNAYYNDQVNTMLNQLSEIYELEDLLIESEETSSKMRANYIISFFAFIGLSILMVLLVYMIRIFSSQRNDLALANKKIREMNSNLEASVAEKTASLKLINHELDTFLYRSSHNLRGPLTTIKGLANIANITLDAEATMLFEKVSLTTNGMERMLDKLTMMNHLNSPTNYSRVNISLLANGILERESDLIKRRNIKLNIDIQEHISFDTYPDIIEIILNNLLENALFYCQFTTSHQSEVDLKIGLDKNDDLVISVRDNGCGIKSEVIDRVWDMFFIGIEKSRGSGLGLFITKKAVDTINGTITLKTEVDHYCEVQVCLPMSEPMQGNDSMVELPTASDPSVEES
jgi:signal transduction histidine kinase